MPNVLDLAAFTQPSSDIGLPKTGSPVDSSIPDNITRSTAPLVQGNTLPPPMASSDPMTTMSGFANLQAQMNQNKLFAQTYAARQKAGLIMSTAPDTETGIQRMLADPQVAPFAGETIAAMRQAQQTLIATQGEQQSQAQSGLQAFLKSLPAIMADPSQWDGVVKAQRATLSPSAQAAFDPAIEALKHSLIDGLPKDPKQASEVFTNRAMGLAIGAGVTPDQLSGVVGKSATENTGGVTRFGVQAPPQLGGGFEQGNAVPNTLAPTVTSGPGNVPLVVGGGGGGMGGSGGSGGGVARPLPTPQNGTNPPGNPPQNAPQNALSAQPAGDGKPLIPPGLPMVSPSVGKGVGGLNLLSASQLDEAKTLQDDYAGPERKAFENANTTMGLLTEMDRDFDTMAKGGGFLVPGSGAKFRSSLAKFANTVGQMVNKDGAPLFDPSKVASIENLTKDTRRMGLTVLTTMLGNQREAAQTISNITQAVPDIENTYLGGKLLISSIKAATQRAIDQRNFENAWQADPRNQGNLTGAIEAFNKAHPAQDYAAKVMDSFGLDATGFKSPQSVIQAVQQGYLTRTQASKILHDQFGKK